MDTTLGRSPFPARGAGLFLGALLCFGAAMAQASRAQEAVPVSPAEPPVDTNTAPASDASGPTKASPASDPGYLLQPDDVIEAVVFREPDLTSDGMLRKDGVFDMKLLGAVKLAGLTLDQAAEVIRVALEKDYLVNPRVTVGMVEYAKRKVDVLGEVRGPGVYAFPPRGPLSLGDAVALAGGFLPTADAVHVSVKRVEADRLVTLTVDASPGAAALFQLLPDDSISVPVLPRRHFTVLGQIMRPGTYEMPDARPVYLTDAIAVAGGFTRIANASHVLLKRTTDGHETVMMLDAKAMAKSAATQRVEIQNEDTITVPESMF